MNRLDTATRATILVVDDTPDNLALLCNLLNDDYKVRVAKGGDKALQIAASETPPDLILLDIMMPSMDGYEVCRRLKRDVRTMNIPVIFLTAKAEEEDEMKGLELGAVDYITKPISPPIVLARVKSQLALKAMADFLLDRNAYLEREVEKRTREAMAIREIAARNRQLEEASRMKSEFLANMSHELRTPLNAIIGFSEVLRDGLIGELSPQQKECASDIFSSGGHLLSLINDILDLSKVEAGKMTLELEPLPVAPLLHAGLRVVREKSMAHRLHLVAEVADGLIDSGDVWLDERKVKQILFNLLSNAVKFTPEGGDVRVAARRIGREAVADGRFDHYLELAVSDTGIGISAADQARLFQPFTQIDSTLARRFEGTGLGLAMVKRLAELHGGRIALQSAPGQGSTFTVWLPWRTENDKPAGDDALASLRQSVPEASSPAGSAFANGAGQTVSPVGYPVANLPAAADVDLPSGIDGLDVANGLHRVLGKKRLYLSMLRKFCAGQKSAVAEIVAALAGQDWDTAQRRAHTIKGVAGNIGAAGVQQLAEKLEAAIRTRQADHAIAERLDELKLPLASLIAQLEPKLPDERPVTPVSVDLVRLKRICEKLEALLADDDSEAVDWLDANSGLLNADLLNAAFPIHYRKIDDGVRAMDFETALAALRAATQWHESERT